MSRLPGASTLRLDRRSWRLDVTSEPVTFEPARRSDDEHVAELGAAILDSCADLHVDLADWVLPLSGGMDSRALLLALLETGRRPRCVTWGLRSAVTDPANDAAVARVLADTTGVEHLYYPTDHSEEDVGAVLDRFLVAGEGRSEDFAGYTDGLATWKQLFESGVAGVIRGDEPGWGYRTYHSESYARRRVHLRVLADYPPSHLIHQLGLEPQPVPSQLTRHERESLTTYRDRIYEAYNLPTFFAALNDVKTPYVEIANPFLTRRVVSVVRSLPDHLREHRRAFAAFVHAYGPDVPFATKAAPAEPTEYLARPGLVAEVRNELESSRAESVLDRGALDRLCAALDASPRFDARRGLRAAARKVIPDELARRLRPNAAILLSARELAFRVCIASRMATHAHRRRRREPRMADARRRGRRATDVRPDRRLRASGDRAALLGRRPAALRRPPLARQPHPARPAAVRGPGADRRRGQPHARPPARAGRGLPRRARRRPRRLGRHRVARDRTAPTPSAASTPSAWSW